MSSPAVRCSPVSPPTLPGAVPPALHVPALRDDSGGRVVVTRWGRVHGHTLRSGDRLLLGAEQEGGLVLLRPRGFGWPMLGRRAEGGLFAEPGGVPASALRWQVVGGLLGVVRELETGVLDEGPWWIEVRIRASDAGAWRAPPGIPDEVGPLSADAAAARCRAAARACAASGGQVAAVASRDPRRLRGLLASAAPGGLLIDLHGVAPAGELVAGPWALQGPGAQLSLFGGVGAGRRAG